MKPHIIILALGALALTAGADTSARAAPKPAPHIEKKSLIEPGAMKALEEMSAYLRTLKTFEVRAATIADTVLDNGQKIQQNGRVTYRVRRPNGFFIETATDRLVRQFYYDGKSFTLFAPRMDFYARVPAPGTIKEVLDVANDKYGIELPLADLFYWGTADARTDNMTSATLIGFANIGGVACEQYAFRQGAIDWQLFIQTGAHRLPRRLVITAVSKPAQPQFVAQLDWTENAKFTDAVFVYTPSTKAHAIHIASN